MSRGTFVFAVVRTSETGLKLKAMLQWSSPATGTNEGEEAINCEERLGDTAGSQAAILPTVASKHCV
jgi:hypothetical protein